LADASDGLEVSQTHGAEADAVADLLLHTHHHSIIPIIDYQSSLSTPDSATIDRPSS
jgi:hypothetical protein